PPRPLSAATRLAARPMRCRLFFFFPPLFLLLPLFLFLFRASFLTALRSDFFCSRTLTSPSPSISASAANCSVSASCATCWLPSESDFLSLSDLSSSFDSSLFPSLDLLLADES